METFDIHEVEENRAKLRAGRGKVLIDVVERRLFKVYSSCSNINQGSDYLPFVTISDGKL